MLLVAPWSSPNSVLVFIVPFMTPYVAFKYNRICRTSVVSLLVSHAASAAVLFNVIIISIIAAAASALSHLVATSF